MKKINNFIAYSVFLFVHFFCKLKKTNGNPNGILFVNIGKIGDAVISSFVFSNEESLVKLGRIGFVMEKSVAELFENYKGDFNLYFVDKRKYKRNILYRLSFLCRLQKANYARVYNFPFTRISIDDEISLISGIKGKTYAFENNSLLQRFWGGKFDKYYSEIFERKKQYSDFQNQKLMLSHIGIGNVNTERKLFYGKNNREIVREKYFVVSPYAGLKIKEWGIENYKLLIKKLTGHLGAKAVILHSETKTDFTKLADETIDLSGKLTLSESAEIIENSLFFVGNDSGLLHIAKALNKKVFGIVGGGVLGRIYPYDENDDATYFFYRTDCFGCDWICKHEIPICLTETKVETVITKILEIFDE